MRCGHDRRGLCGGKNRCAHDGLSTVRTSLLSSRSSNLRCRESAALSFCRAVLDSGIALDEVEERVRELGHNNADGVPDRASSLPVANAPRRDVAASASMSTIRNTHLL